MNKIEKLNNRAVGYKREPGFVSVIAALVGNFVITILKAIGFAVSGSSSLFSEAVHSFADTANQALLMVGIIKSRRAPDEESSYGYGLERFFWALISACGVFFVGAGVTIYHGVSTVIHPGEPIFKLEVFIILAVSFVVEFITFLIAFRELWNERGEGATLADTFRDGDPTVLAVVYEDSVAVFGVFVAGVSIGLSYLTGNPIWDAMGSIVIGALLAWVAVVLILKNKRFLVEKSIPEDVKERIIEMLVADPMIERVYDFKSSVVELGKYRAKCEVEVNGTALFKELSNGIMFKEDYETVKEDYQEFLRYIVDYTDRVPRVIGTRIDELEERIKIEIPAVKHIDIEIN
ncbi:MAG: cation diffusion facilitator family transporter [Candidatus Roizmanbacteria bacterium]|nr:cation diffusion facilitator family transporter [Candidatus Roizmanbacteria bacterium]